MIGALAIFVQQVVLPLGLAYFIMKNIVKNGKRLVNRPQLCPDLSHPWKQDAAVAPGGLKKH